MAYLFIQDAMNETAVRFSSCCVISFWRLQNFNSIIEGSNIDALLDLWTLALRSLKNLSFEIFNMQFLRHVTWKATSVCEVNMVFQF